MKVAVTYRGTGVQYKTTVTDEYQKTHVANTNRESNGKTIKWMTYGPVEIRGTNDEIRRFAYTLLSMCE